MRIVVVNLDSKASTVKTYLFAWSGPGDRSRWPMFAAVSWVCMPLLTTATKHLGSIDVLRRRSRSTKKWGDLFVLFSFSTVCLVDDGLFGLNTPFAHLRLVRDPINENNKKKTKVKPA